MLEIKNVSKVYELGKKKDKNYQVVKALKGVSVNFRQNEFVSILGQSGCGKTTLLNIIGGLDRYTKGDLVIDGKSTKNFTSNDWDTYRNKKVGFVFQSYNLIPHLTVFENVELALTLSGTSKSERKDTVIKSLQQVGLGDKIYAKPNQLSGGQMQRVAIARALINNPEIILADEPTGALDSKTSVQIMDILKEISKDKLIIMVTHNPELADAYASRTIRLLDGEIQSDSNPYTPEKSEEKPIGKKKRMSFFTALSLSLKNLLTKKTRTILVSIAGSIGIIGIALILAMSSGFQNYVNKVQENTLSSYPLTISSVSVDYSSMLSMMMGDATENNGESEEGVVNKNDVIVGMFKNFLSGTKQNNLEEFKKYIDLNYNDIKDYTTGIQYTYNMNMSIYDNANNVQLNPNSIFYNGTMYWLDIKLGASVFPIFEQNYKTATSKPNDYVLTQDEVKAIKATSEYQSALLSAFASVLGDNGANLVASISGLKNSQLTSFVEMIDNSTLLKSQYDVLATSEGFTANNLFENLTAKDIVLVLDKNGNLSDYSLYTLGIKTTPTVEEIALGLADADNYEIPTDEGYAYNTLINKEYKILLDTDYYVDIANDNVYKDIRKEFSNKNISEEQYNTYVTNKLADANTGMILTIKGIVKPNEKTEAASINGDIGYTHALTQLMVEKINSATNVLPLSTEEKNALTIDLDKPSSINFYCTDFDAKKQIEKFIEEYNTAMLADTEKGEDYTITYSDYVGILMSSISTIIGAITYVLIAFVSVSLIVSSIMIGIITYISVLERIKEIGILRSIGASKKDIKNVFTAESLIIGFSAGAIGIIFTVLMCIPINIIINSLAGLGNVAQLPILAGVILIALSMLLTFIAGLIPARIASKKDPVIALRTD